MNPHSYRLKGRDFVHQGKIEIDVNERAVFIRTQGCFFVYTNSDCFLNSCLSTLSVWGINKLYFGKMAELGATCYFDTRMCATAGLMVIGSVNFIVIMLLALYSGNTWEVSNLQTVIYILTAYLVSGSLDFGILLFKTGEKASVAMAAGILICSGVYIVVSNISGALFSASISIWAGVCAVAGGLTFVQVKRLFSAGEMVFEEA